MIWISHIEIGCQKGRIQIPLDGTNPAGAHVKALRQRLFHADPAAMAKLAQTRGACGNFDQGAARARPRCVSAVLQTSPELVRSRFSRIASAMLHKSSFRG